MGPVEGPSPIPSGMAAGMGRWLLLIALLAFSATSALGNSNRKGKWYTHETRHFRIVYHDEVKAQADFAKGFLEQAYAAMVGRLEVPDRNILITVVLTGMVDESNGYATPLGHKIVIWTRPGQVIASNDIAWLRRVLTHELAHQITFLALRNFFGIYGELYKSSGLPVWFLEGLAQYLGESWDAKRNTFFAHALYNSALEPYPAMAAFTKLDPVSGRLVYEQGHAFVRFIAARNGGPAFLGRLLRKVTMVPIYNEVKGLLSPLTARWLPLESALLSLTGKGISEHYGNFLQAMEAGAPGDPALPASPLIPGAGELDVVLQARQAGPDDFVISAQEDWDLPYISLYRVRGGKAEKLAASFVNPIFDLSGDGRRVAYVREYADVDGEPVNKLFILDLESGRETFVSDRAYHPAFLGGDSVAFSRWDLGRQALVLCAPGAAPSQQVPKAPAASPGPAAPAVPAVSAAYGCREEAADSLTGIYALSRSRQGLLMNATDRAGRTGIYEYAPGAGIRRILQDTVPSEFPVEADDGSIAMIRETEGLLQVVSMDRATGAFTPLTGHPSGTFFLHRAGPGRLASVAQVGDATRWRLAPVEVRPPPGPAAAPGLDTGAASVPGPGAADSAAIAAVAPIEEVSGDSGVYRAPEFLKAPLLLPGTVLPPAKPRPGRSYLSLLQVRPLLFWPYVANAFPLGTLGAGGLFQDPLELHTLQGSIGMRADEDPIYNVAYLNAQTPVQVSAFSSNSEFTVDSLTASVAGWKTLYAVQQMTRAELALLSRAPWDMPAPHALYMAAAFGGEWQLDRVGGETAESKQAEFTDWSRRRQWAYHRLSIGYSYALPYAYAMVHPLRETSFGLAHLRRYPGGDDFVHLEARNVFPIWHELTLTAFYQGTLYAAEFQQDVYPLPDGNTVQFTSRREQGSAHDVYAGLDIPLLKGYLFELPLFGICNYVGAGAFGAYGRDDFEKNPFTSRPALSETQGFAGARLYALFHVLRKLPLVLSAYAQYDFQDDAFEYRFGTEVGGIPSQVTGWLKPLHPRGARGLKESLAVPFER